MKNKIFISLLLILFFITLFFSNKSSDKNSNDKKENPVDPADIKKLEYLQNNMAEINTKDDSFAVLADFNKSIKNYDIFLTGKYAGIAKSYDIMFYLLKNFNKNHGVRYILLETGFSDGCLLNKYLQNGDKKILNSIFEQRLRTDSYTKEYYEFYVNVYEYNKTLPENKKLVFIGIDIQHQIVTGKNYLFDVLSSKPPESISEVINKFKEQWNDDKFTSIWNDSKYNTAIEEIQTILNDMERNSEIYGEYLGEEYFNFKFACENIIQTFECYRNRDNPAFYTKRKEYIQNNFEAVYKYYGNGKYYGDFGSDNISLKYSEIIGAKTIAEFIEFEHEETKGKTLSISFEYNNCKVAVYLNDFAPVDVDGKYSSVINKKTISLITSLSKFDFTLFNLINVSSPFIKYIDNTDKKYSVYGCQYCLLIKNSPAVKKYE